MPTVAEDLVLLVDGDEPTIVRGFARILTSAGFSVQIAHDGREAAELARGMSFDAIVSDIAMPEMTGLQLLRSVREHDLDVPVILMTGGPAVESAVQAVEYGALRYLIKPVDSKQLEEVVARATRLHQMAKIKREALELFRLEGKRLGDRAGLEARFANAINTLWMAYQPIVTWNDETVIAYEALVRNDEPTLRAPPALSTPPSGSTACATSGASSATAWPRPWSTSARRRRGVRQPAPLELLDDSLTRADVAAVGGRQARGAGDHRARVRSRSQGRPTRRVAQLRKHRLPHRRRRSRRRLRGPHQLRAPRARGGQDRHVPGARARPVADEAEDAPIDRGPLPEILEIKMIAEGIETVEERDTLVRLGGDLCQGYLFARPERAFRRSRFEGGRKGLGPRGSDPDPEALG